MVESTFFSPKKTRMAGEKENNPAFNVKVDPVQVANINKYNEQTPSLDYAPDRIGDYIRDTEVKSYRDDRSEDEKNQDTIKKYFTREDGGVFKNEDEFNRKTTTYYTDKDGIPAAINAFGEKVNYDTETIKRYISTDAKEKYQNTQQQKLNQSLSVLQQQNQKIDDYNYYKRNLTFNEKGEPDPTNKYVLTAPEMRERMKDLGPNESMDKYGIIRPYKEQDAINKKQEETNRLQKAKEESENKNVFQKIGDTVGDVFNKLTGIQPAKGDTLQSQGINTNATVNLSQMGDVSPTVQKAREAVEKSVIQQTGMPSNPRGFSGYSRPSSTSTGRVGSKSSARGARGGSSSRSRGGTGTGRAGQGSKSSARGARGSAGSRGRGGTGSGRTSTSRSASKASKGRTGRGRSQCDIRTKIDISPLINSNLVKDDLAKLAYFVQEIK